MTTREVGIAGAITIRQLKRLCELAEVEGGYVNRTTFQAYLDHQDSFPFKRNKHGDTLVTFKGRDLVGWQELNYLIEKCKLSISSSARVCIAACQDAYDQTHRLIEGRPYTLALLRVSPKAAPDGYLTADEIRTMAQERGYGALLAGHITHLAEALTPTLMDGLGLMSVIGLHEPLPGLHGRECLQVYRDEGHVTLDVGAVMEPVRIAIGRRTAFAFPVIEW